MTEDASVWQAEAVFTPMGPKRPVQDSPDLRRIEALARRPVFEGERLEALVEVMTRRLSRPNAACKCAELGRPCITRLTGMQAWTLYEAGFAEGILGAVIVGGGKTGLDILAAMVVPGCKRAVLLIPSNLREQLLGDYHAWSQHFHVPSIVMGKRGFIWPGRPVVNVIAYSQLSQASSTTLLEQLQPDVVIADELHRLKSRAAARTSRFLRAYSKRPSTRFLGWSGTVTTRSVNDYGHLAALALRDQSPLPLDSQIVQEWGLALDASDWPAPAGELRRLCQPSEDLAEGFRRRLLETRGVISSKEAVIGASINIGERTLPEVPTEIQTLLASVRKTWVRPDGEELVDALSVHACAVQLASGFYYRWVFPRGESEELIAQWFAARKAWKRELREKIRPRRPHLDSPHLGAMAAIRGWSGEKYDGKLPVWKADTWPAWRDVKGLVEPETRAVWVDDFLIRDAAAWATSHRGVVWYEHATVGDKLAAALGAPKHAGGPNAEEEIKLELARKGDRCLVASIKAHGTGRDGLQNVFSDQLVVNPPASGDTWEQLIGRLHRIGQTADEVTTTVYRHTEEYANALDKSLHEAKYVEGTWGSLQKLLCATVEWSF